MTGLKQLDLTKKSLFKFDEDIPSDWKVKGWVYPNVNPITGAEKCFNCNQWCQPAANYATACSYHPGIFFETPKNDSVDVEFTYKTPSSYSDYGWTCCYRQWKSDDGCKTGLPHKFVKMKTLQEMEDMNHLILRAKAEKKKQKKWF